MNRRTQVYRTLSILIFLIGWRWVNSAFGEPLVAFQRVEGGNNEIYLLDVTTGEEWNLTNHPAPDGDPSWSPDGRQLVFTSDRTGFKEIYVMDRTGGNLRQLTDGPTLEMNPSWSPDGKQIAFGGWSGLIGDRWNIYVMNADGTHPRKLTDKHFDYQPSWSPDSAKIAFTRRDGGTDIYVVDAAGGGERRLIKDGYSPAWSPDGQSIAFISSREGMPNLSIFEIESGSIKPLKVDFPPENPDWTVDDRQILVDNRDDHQLYLVDAQTGKAERLGKRPIFGFNARWFEPRPRAITPQGKLPTRWGNIKR
ncbi:PD40 domain-containing protein [Candidatus Poribacteria bacterium]|nr:PD40 domain-containing protein [Candidatus Poribacteria bacterium]